MIFGLGDKKNKKKYHSWDDEGLATPDDRTERSEEVGMRRGRKRDGEGEGGEMDLHFLIGICKIYYKFNIFIIDYKNNNQFLCDFIHFVIGFLLFFGVPGDLREFRRLIRSREVECEICLKVLKLKVRNLSFTQA